MMKCYSSLLTSKEQGCNKDMLPMDEIPILPSKGMLGNNRHKTVFRENDVYHNIRDDAYYILLLILFLFTKK